MKVSTQSTYQVQKISGLLRSHTNSISISTERLASGLRINSSSDDVAGLGIATRMQSQISGLQAAIKNSQDGINLSQTADGYLAEVEQVLLSMRELVVQGLTETNAATERAAIQIELDAQKQTISGMLRGAQFNQINLFDGTFRDQGFMVGTKSDQALNVSIDKFDLSHLGRRLSLLGSSGVDTSVSLIDTASGTPDSFSINGIAIRDSVAADDALSTLNAAHSAIAKAAAINSAFEQTGVRATVLATRTDEQATLDASLGAGVLGSSGSIQATQLTSSTYFKINDVAISGFAVSANDADGALTDAINAQFEKTGVTAAVSSAGELVLEALDGRNIEVEYVDNDGVTLMGNIGLLDGGGEAYGGRLLIEGEGTTSFNFGSDVNSFLGDLVGNHGHSGNAFYSPQGDQALETLEVTSNLGRRRALSTIDTSIRQLSDERAFFGALQNRFEQTINTLSDQKVNLESAASHIRDADFIVESAQFARDQIRLNTAVSIMAQANVQPIVAFSLVQSIR